MTSVRNFLAMGWLLLAIAAAGSARAQLRVDVTQGVIDPIPIAVVPFAAAVDPGLDIAAVVQHDLESSGRFRAMTRAAMKSKRSSAEGDVGDGTPSMRLFRTRTSPSTFSFLDTSLRNVHFLMFDSIIVKLIDGRASRMGRPGKPAPDPTSASRPSEIAPAVKAKILSPK